MWNVRRLARGGRVREFASRHIMSTYENVTVKLVIIYAQCMHIKYESEKAMNKIKWNLIVLYRTQATHSILHFVGNIFLKS